jgi:hypothetical protein
MRDEGERTRHQRRFWRPRRKDVVRDMGYMSLTRKEEQEMFMGMYYQDNLMSRFRN